MAFAHLHVHSEYSMLDGAQSVSAMVERVEKMGQGAVALTDHGWISGAVRLTQECQKRGIKPIVGMEAYVCTGESMEKPGRHRGDNFHLTLIARNAEGYRNLMRMTSESFIRGLSWVPRIDKELLARHSEGITLLTGCIGAEVPQLIVRGREAEARRLVGWYQEQFGDHVAVEIMYHGGAKGVDHVRVEEEGRILMEESQLNDALRSIADAHGLPMVATNDAHYALREDGCAHDTLLCLGTGSYKDEEERFQFPGFEHGPDAWEYYVKSEEEMRAVHEADWWQRACDNTARLVESIEDCVIPLGQTMLPPYEVPEDDLAYRVWKETGAFI